MRYNNLKQTRILEWYDGPLLIEFRDEENNCFLFHWVDLDDTLENIGKNLWCVYNVADDQLECYLNNKISLLDLYLNSKNNIVDILIENKSGFDLKIQVSKQELLENYKDYLPVEGIKYLEQGRPIRYVKYD